MDNNLILTPIPLPQLLQAFREIIKEEIKAEQEKELQAQFLSPEETTKLFNPKISIGTLNNWAAEGLITKHFIKGKTWYKYAEIMEAVKHLSKYKKGLAGASH